MLAQAREGQLALAVVPGPALVVGPVFLCFEVSPIKRAKGPPALPFKKRHRTRLVTPQHSRPFTQEYSDPEGAAWERSIAQIAALNMNGKLPTARPVALLVHAFKPVPESWSQRDREAALQGGLLPITKPDWDNFGKITDALNGVAWIDDAQVCDGRVIKRYSADPALRIEVREFIEATTTR